MTQILVLINHSENGIVKGTKMLNDKLTQAVAEAYKKMKQEELKGDQHKIDANKNGEIDAHDFKILRGQKNEEVELEPGQGSHLNLGGARVKNTHSAVLAHVQKAFPNAKEIKKTSYGWGPKHEETEPETEKEKNLAALGHPKDKITHKDVLIGRGVLKKEEWDSKKSTVSEAEELNEDLRNWFKSDHPEGGWKRINSKGEAIGPCAREPGEPKPKCMSNEKRASLSKDERAAAVAAKRRHDPNPERKGKPINVSNFGKGKISESVEYIEEKNAPTNPELWSRAKAMARQKFDVYPSAYANGWAAKWYKSKGGGWKSVSEELDLKEKNLEESKLTLGNRIAWQHSKDVGLDGPKEMLKRHRGMDTNTLKSLSNKGPVRTDNSPAGLQQRIIKHELKKRTQEEVELDEMDKSQTPPGRGSENEYERNGKTYYGKPVTRKQMERDSLNALKKALPTVKKEGFELTEGNDDVGEMIKDKLKIIINRAKEMHDGIGPNTDMPEWVKSKITLAQDYVSTACDYSCGSEQLGEGTEQVDERCWDGYKPVDGKEAYSKGSCTKEEELQEGRPSQRHPLEGHDYHKKSHAELSGIIKDAGEAKQNAREMGHEKNENKYADQVNDAATVLHWRKQNGTPGWYQKKYGHTKNEEVEIQEDMGEPDIKVRSTYTKAYADHYKRALRMNPKGATTKAKIMAYDTVSAKHGEDAADALRAFHDKNQNEEIQIDEALSSRAKMVKELFNKAKEKKTKKDVFEADPEMEIMPSPQYAQPKK
jgi:hypothetical protein